MSDIAHTQPVWDWAKERLGQEFIELPALPLAAQLQQYEEAQSGMGFILLLALTSLDTESDCPEATHLTMVSVPIVKVKGQWVTMRDENLADILSGIVRLIAPQISEETPNGRTDVGPQGADSEGPDTGPIG